MGWRLARRLDTRKPAQRTTNSIGMELVLIEPGSLLVGSSTPRSPSFAAPLEALGPDLLVPPFGAEDGVARLTPEEHQRFAHLSAPSRRPGFTARIERPFYIGKYEVTQAHWTKVMGSNPSVFEGCQGQGRRRVSTLSTVSRGKTRNALSRN